MSSSETRLPLPFTHRIAVATLVATIAACGPHSAARAEGETVFPGGASSLNETFQDWQVACTMRDRTPVCEIAQEHRDPQSGRLVFAARFAPVGEDGAVSGRLVLPFGLLLSVGATLQVGDKSASQPLAFRTCLPIGCILPVTLDMTMLEAARTGASFRVITTMSETDQPLTFTISSKGFGTALHRAGALTSE